MISVIIPYCGDDELRRGAFKALLDVLNHQDFLNEIEIVIVTQHCGSQYQSGHYCVGNTHHVNIHKAGSFNKAWCINVGVRLAKGQTIIVMDADTICGQDYIRYINYYFNKVYIEENTALFAMGWQYLICLPGRDNPYARAITPGFTQACGGVFVFDKLFFINEVGMMNESYEGYGGEDNDLFYRVKAILGRDPNNIPYALAHAYHHWSVLSDHARMSDIVRLYPQEVTTRLKEKELGNMGGPVKIEMLDIGVE